MAQKTFNLPLSIEVVTSNQTDYRCHECGKSTHKVNILLVRNIDAHLYLYCNKCARAKLETIAAHLNFMLTEVNNLLQHFPKKIKLKHDSIESGILSSL